MLSRCPRDDFQIGNLRYTRQDFILDAIGKVGVGFVLAPVFEWKHGDGFLGNRCSDGGLRILVQHELVRQQQHNGQRQDCDDPAIDVLALLPRGSNARTSIAGSSQSWRWPLCCCWRTSSCCTRMRRPPSLQRFPRNPSPCFHSKTGARTKRSEERRVGKE